MDSWASKLARYWDKLTCRVSKILGTLRFRVSGLGFKGLGFKGLGLRSGVFRV